MNDSSKQAEKYITVSPKDFKALKKSNYENIRHKFNKAFVLKHKKTDRIVEIRATSSFQACKFIGWKCNQVVVIEEKDLSNE